MTSEVDPVSRRLRFAASFALSSWALLGWALPSLALSDSAIAEPTALRTAPVDSEGPLAAAFGDDTKRDGKKVERLDAWPPPEDEDQVELDIERIRKARTPAMATQAMEMLRAEGAGAAPYLIAAFGKERNEDARERLREVLDDVTGAPHTRLIARHFGHKSRELRRWALARVARFPDKGVIDAAKSALERVRKESKKNKREKDRPAIDEELYYASLCCMSAGSTEGMDVVVARARGSWGDHGVEIRSALEAVRGPKASEVALALIGEDDRTDIVTGLHLLAGCGEPEKATDKIRPFLDHTDNSIRVAAINALRGIVDGDPPVERLPVFEAIERANAWKKRI